jgi:hypothetical protein
MTATSRPRPNSNSRTAGPPSKRQKIAESSRSGFADGIFESSNILDLSEKYRASKPFKHVVLRQLFRDELLESVKDECIQELSFTEKETDIYKVVLHCTHNTTTTKRPTSRFFKQVT